MILNWLYASQQNHSYLPVKDCANQRLSMLFEEVEFIRGFPGNVSDIGNTVQFRFSYDRRISLHVRHACLSLFGWYLPLLQVNFKPLWNELRQHGYGVGTAIRRKACDMCGKLYFEECFEGKFPILDSQNFDPSCLKTICNLLSIFNSRIRHWFNFIYSLVFYSE